MPGKKILHVAFVGGPMYDHLYELLPRFEERSGYQVSVDAKLIHPELNSHLDSQFKSGKLNYDVISTHTKYAPSQQPFLTPLDEFFTNEELAAFVPATVNLARFKGQLLGIPRNIDVRLLYFRRDLFDDPKEQAAFKEQFGYALAVPTTWKQLIDVARHFTRPRDLYGFAFAGRLSGLFGNFFELVTMMGGRLFNQDLSPAFVTDAGETGLGVLRDLYLTFRATPPQVPEWHFDEVANAFRAGQVAMVTDWPSGFGTMRDPRLSKVADKLDLALYPVGSTGERWVYAGGFTFAIPTTVKERDGALALLRFLTSQDAQWVEAQHGAVSPRLDVRERMQESVKPGSLEARRLEMLEQTVQNNMLIPPHFASYPAVEDALWTALQTGFTGERSVREALVVAAEQMREFAHE